MKPTLWRLPVALLFVCALAGLAFATAYNTAPPIVMSPRGTAVVWNAETPTPGTGTTSASQQVLLYSPGAGNTPFSVDGAFSGNPGAFEVDVQVASSDSDTSYTQCSGCAITTTKSSLLRQLHLPSRLRGHDSLHTPIDGRAGQFGEHYGQDQPMKKLLLFLAVLCGVVPALAQNGGYVSPAQGGGSGANPGGAACNLQYQVNGTTFGGATTTCVLNSGANQIPSTPVAGTTYLLFDTSANYTQSAAITGSANNVRILCGAGVVVQFTGATSGFNITGNGWYIDPNCTFDHNSQSASGTGPLFKVSGNDDIIQGYVQNTGTTNPASSTILITGGSRNKVLGVRFLGTQADSCIGLVPTAEAFDTLIQDNIIPTFNPSAASLNCINVQFNSSSTATSQVRTSLIHNTIVGQGANADLIIYQDQSISIVATSQNPKIAQNILTLTGSVNEMLKAFAFREGHVDENILNDGGTSVLEMIHLGDLYQSSISLNVLNGTSASGRRHKLHRLQRQRVFP